MGRSKIDGPSMRRDMNDFDKVMSGELTENIDNISAEQAQAEGEEFLRIVGMSEKKVVKPESDKPLREDKYDAYLSKILKNLTEAESELRKMLAIHDDGVVTQAELHMMRKIEDTADRIVKLTDQGLDG